MRTIKTFPSDYVLIWKNVRVCPCLFKGFWKLLYNIFGRRDVNWFIFRSTYLDLAFRSGFFSELAIKSASISVIFVDGDCWRCSPPARRFSNTCFAQTLDKKNWLKTVRFRASWGALFSISARVLFIRTKSHHAFCLATSSPAHITFLAVFGHGLFLFINRVWLSQWITDDLIPNYGSFENLIILCFFIYINISTWK